MDAELPGRCHVEAWAPQVPGIREVFHARMVDYAYPPHCHETWAVLIVDDGAIRYDLDRRRCGAAGQTVTILPPGVAHDGRPAPGASGFRKRELYLDPAFLPAELTGAAVDHTAISDPALRAALSRLHDCLLEDAEDLDAGARLALIAERITGHLTRVPHPAAAPEPGIAGQLRQLLDEHITGQVSLAWAAATLDRSIPHLVRSFTRQFGLSPHAYVIGRRIDAARRLMLRGAAPADVATAVGFYDQAHFTRHFKRHTATTPAGYARSHAPGLRRLPLTILWILAGAACPRCRSSWLAGRDPGYHPAQGEARQLQPLARSPFRLAGMGVCPPASPANGGWLRCRVADSERCS